MFDIGWSEFLVIGVVALVVIGPKELPGVIRTIGKSVGKMRRMAGEFQGQFQEALREADLADVKKTLSGLADDAQESVSSVKQSISASIPTNPLLDIENQLKDAATPVERKDLPAVDNLGLPEPTELETNVFETIEQEVRTAAADLATPASIAEPVALKPVEAAKSELPKSGDAKPEAKAVAAPAVAETPAKPKRAPRRKPVAELPEDPRPAEPEIAQAVADLDGAPAKPKRKPRVRKTAADTTPDGDEGPKA